MRAILEAMRASTLAASSLLVICCSCLAGGEQAAPAPAPATPTATPEAPLAITTLARGTDSEWHEAAEVAVREEKAWKDLWEKANAALVPMPAPPKVDFAKEMVIAVFAGEKPTTGHSIEVSRIERSGDGLLVTVREKAPPEGAMVGQALTYPFHIVRVPAAAGEVEFRREARSEAER